MSEQDEAIAKACCADLYQSDIARLILGDTLHPGGLSLTYRLGHLMDIQPGEWVVDLASGRGTSATALSRAFHCRVAGVEFGARSVREAYFAAAGAPVPSQAFFIQGDAEQPPILPGSVDAMICECSMSIFPRQLETACQVVSTLRPGGRFGLSDVTVEPGSLPAELEGVLGQVLCLTGALNAAGYINLLVKAGMKVKHQEDVSSELLKLLLELEHKLEAFTILRSMNQVGLPPGQGWLPEAPALIDQVKQLVVNSQLGYWLFVAEKPA